MFIGVVDLKTGNEIYYPDEIRGGIHVRELCKSSGELTLPA